MSRWGAVAGAVLLCGVAQYSGAVQLNELMMRGSQASYRLAPEGEVAEIVPSLYLCQRPLDRQASFDQVSAFQLDIHKRPTETDSFPVYHSQFGDDNRSNCDDLMQCVWVLNEWSDKNPNHPPIILEINAVDEPGQVRDDLRPGWPLALEEQLVAVLGIDKIYTPYELIGDGEPNVTINQRVTNYGWPDLDELKGKFIIVVTRYNSAVYAELTAFVENPQYPQPSNVFFLAACGSYNITQTNPCPASEMSKPWAGIADVDFYGSNPAEWSSAEATIRAMVAANFVVNSNVCADYDTAWYLRRDICANKSLLAQELGVHILSDALLSVSNNPTLPTTTICNPVTSTAESCSDADLGQIPAPGSDPWYVCDMNQCPPAPPADVRTTIPPDQCVDDDAKIRELTGGLAQSCRQAQTAFPDACYNEDSPYYDLSLRYCPVTCGICDKAVADNSFSPRPFEPSRTVGFFVGPASSTMKSEPTEYGYVDPCADIQPQSTSNPKGLTNAEWAGVVIGIAIIIIIIAIVLNCRRRGKLDDETTPLVG